MRTRFILLNQQWYPRRPFFFNFQRVWARIKKVLDFCHYAQRILRVMHMWRLTKCWSFLLYNWYIDDNKHARINPCMNRKEDLTLYVQGIWMPNIDSCVVSQGLTYQLNASDCKLVEHQQTYVLSTTSDLRIARLYSCNVRLFRRIKSTVV